MSFPPPISILAAAAFLAIAGAASAQSVETGQQLFHARCAACHGLGAMADFSPGPAIAGIVGRRIASLPAYEYSAGLKAVKGVWTAENLNDWLKNPESFAPGTSMKLALPDVNDRANVIAYLQTLH